MGYKNLVRLLIIFALTGWGCTREGSKKIRDDGLNKAETILLTDQASGAQTLTGKTVALPADWPADVPLPKMARVTSVLREKNALAGLLLNAPIVREEALSFYRQQLPAQGWTILAEQPVADTVIFSIKKSKRALTIAIGPGEKNDTATLNILFVQPEE